MVVGLAAFEHCSEGHMPATAIKLLEKFQLFNELWSPRVVAELNDYQVKLARIDGEFVWHEHADTDELFFCLEGSMTIEMHDGDVTLGPGDLYVVPKGTQHRPVTRGECKILLLEPRGVVNTGEVQSELTAALDQWI
jgi:mannose-6-phosphate isomerase-like protein (cupin superfamily)